MSVLLAHSHAAHRLSLITTDQTYRLEYALKAVRRGLKIGCIEVNAPHLSRTPKSSLPSKFYKR